MAFAFFFCSFGPELQEVDYDLTDDLGHILPWWLIPNSFNLDIM